MIILNVLSNADFKGKNLVCREVGKTEVLQRFDSSEKSRFCSKTALPKCLTINDWLFCKIAKARGFSAKSKSCNTSPEIPMETTKGELKITWISDGNQIRKI